MTISISEQINPYIIGRPIYEPEHFFGRNDLFAFIQDNLSQKTKVILLHGQRRIGKSSVLSQVPNFVKLDNFVFVILSLEGKSKKSLNDVLYELAKEIKSYLEDELEFSVQNIEIAKREVFQEDRNVFTRDFLPQVYEVLGNKNLVLLLDEFDVLEDGAKDAAIDHFFPYLRSIIDKQNYLYIIPVVGRRLDDIPSLLQLFHEAPHQEIGLLRRENAEKLILEPAKGILTYEEDAVDTILELTSGHPYFTQVVCFALFSKAREDERTIITREDVEGIVDRAIELGEGGLVWFRDGLEIPERFILFVIAVIQKSDLENEKKYESDLSGFLNEHGVIATNQLLRARENLYKWGYLSATEPYVSEITVNLVYHWLVQRFLIKQEIRELEKIDPESVEKYNFAIGLIEVGESKHSSKLLEEVFATNPNHFSALLKLAEIHVLDFAISLVLYERAYKFDKIHEKEYYNVLLAHAKNCLLKADFENSRESLEKINEIQLSNNIYQFMPLSELLSRKNLLEAKQKKITIGSPLPSKFKSVDLSRIVLIYERILEILRENLDFSEAEIEIFEAQYNFWLNYQRKIEEYTQAILEANYKENPISLKSREDLHKLQKKLGLKDEDAKVIRHRFITKQENDIEYSKQLYKQEFEKYISNGKISPIARRIMNLRQVSFALTDSEVEKIEQEILDSYQELNRSYQEYENALYEAISNEYPLSKNVEFELDQLKQILQIIDDSLLVQIYKKVTEKIISEAKRKLLKNSRNFRDYFKDSNYGKQYYLIALEQVKDFILKDNELKSCFSLVLDKQGIEELQNIVEIVVPNHIIVKTSSSFMQEINLTHLLAQQLSELLKNPTQKDAIADRSLY